MGQVGLLKDKELEKKYKNILASRQLVEDALDLDKRLKQISDHMKDFEKDIHPLKDKEQKKIREF